MRLSRGAFGQALPRTAGLLGTGWPLTGFATSHASRRAVTIGGTFSLSGPFAAIGRPLQQGFQLWVEEQNARGGLLGRRIALILRDDRSDPAQAMRHYTVLVQEADLLLTPYGSWLTGAVFPRLSWVVSSSKPLPWAWKSSG